MIMGGIPLHTCSFDSIILTIKMLLLLRYMTFMNFLHQAKSYFPVFIVSSLTIPYPPLHYWYLKVY
jgi:hypothetical protein